MTLDVVGVGTSEVILDLASWCFSVDEDNNKLETSRRNEGKSIGEKSKSRENEKGENNFHL